MNRRPWCSAGLFASVVVVLVSVLSGCTDPNRMRANNANDPPEHESRLSR